MRPVPESDLLQAYLDGLLGQDQVRALEHRLIHEPRLADALMTLAREDAIVQRWATGWAPEAIPVPEAVPVRPAAKSQPSLWPRTTWRQRTVAAAAVLLVTTAAGLVFWSGKSDHRETASARVEEVQGDVVVVSENGDPVAARPGQPLTSGERVQTRGEDSFAVVALGDTSHLELGADTSVRFIGEPGPTKAARSVVGKRVFFEQGVMAADAGPSPEATPMVVTTAHAEALLRDARAQFASLGKGTRIEQEKGRAHVTRVSDGRSIDMPPGSFAVASASENFSAQPMPAGTASPRRTWGDATLNAQTVAYAPDGLMVAVGTCDGNVKLCETATGKVRATLKCGKKCVKTIAYAPDGSLLATVGDDHKVKLWSPVDGKELPPLKSAQLSADFLAFSRDSTMLATTSHTHNLDLGETKVWQLATRAELATFPGRPGGVGTLAFSPDGRLLAGGAKDGTVLLWDVTTHENRGTLAAHNGRVTALAFSDDGMTLASAGKAPAVHLWDGHTGADRGGLAGLNGDVRALAFAPGRHLLAVAGCDVRLWDTNTERERLALKGHRGCVSTVAFAPNGKSLATTCCDKTVRFWDVPE
jgi:anti-sigma factor RsiW